MKAVFSFSLQKNGKKPRTDKAGEAKTSTTSGAFFPSLVNDGEKLRIAFTCCHRRTRGRNREVEKKMSGAPDLRVLRNRTLLFFGGFYAHSTQ